MTDNRKLPIPFQLILVTATVMLIVAAIRIFFITLVIWRDWDLIQATPGVLDWSSVYLPVVFNLTLATISAFIFGVVLKESRHAADYSFLFLVGLVGMLLWSTYAWVMHYRSIWEYQDMSKTIWAFAIIKAALFAWLGVLLAAVYPKTALRRFVSRRHA